MLHLRDSLREWIKNSESFRRSVSDRFETSSPSFIEPELEYEVSSELDASSTNTERQANTKPTKTAMLLAVTYFFCRSAYPVVAKGQVLVMYKYPLFLNLYLNFWFMILGLIFYRFNNTTCAVLPFSKVYLYLLGSLDAVASLLFIIVMMVAPIGSVVVLLSQLYTPFMTVAFYDNKRGGRWSRTQLCGAVLAVIGLCAGLWWPWLSSTSYSCYAKNSDQDCPVCKYETTAETCLSHLTETSSKSIFNVKLLYHKSIENETTMCQWLPTLDIDHHAQVWVFSVILLACKFFVAISFIYQKVSSTYMVDTDPVVTNACIGIIRFITSCIITWPVAYLLDTFQILSNNNSSLSTTVFQQFRNGWLCLTNQHTSDSGCHLDLCEAWQAAIWVHLLVLCILVSTIVRWYLLRPGSAMIDRANLCSIPVALVTLTFLPHVWSELTIAHASSNRICSGVVITGILLYCFGNFTKTNLESENLDVTDDLLCNHEDLLNTRIHSEALEKIITCTSNDYFQGMRPNFDDGMLVQLHQPLLMGEV